MRGEAADGEIGVQYVIGSDEFPFSARGEWLFLYSIAVMVVQYHEVLATARRGDSKTYSLESAYFSSEFNCL